jgi:2,3-bisphosphoglycerate-independent phosphoglycerate mutase
MKYIVILPDGMADLPIEALDNKTPLEYAKTPNMDYMAENGITGCVNTVPAGMKPGSDVANMSVLGINPKEVSIGRGALESLAMGVRIDPDKIIFRANFVTVKDNKMSDYTGGGIKSSEGRKLISLLNKELKNFGIKFIPGLDYRNIAVLDKSKLDIKTTPPHDITDKRIDKYLPQGNDASLIRDIMFKTRDILEN